MSLFKTNIETNIGYNHDKDYVMMERFLHTNKHRQKFILIIYFYLKKV